MQRFEGTKRLSARLMTRGEYNAYRGWDTPHNEDPADAGYLVEYEEGGKANDPRHAGYISWSPADVFERTYKPLREPHQQRVIEEKAQLDDRLTKLHAFFKNPMFSALPLDERSRLVRQAGHMDAYAAVLAERIAAF